MHHRCPSSGIDVMNAPQVQELLFKQGHSSSRARDSAVRVAPNTHELCQGQCLKGSQVWDSFATSPRYIPDTTRLRSDSEVRPATTLIMKLQILIIPVQSAGDVGC